MSKNRKNGILVDSANGNFAIAEPDSSSSDLTAVATTAATNSTPYGYAQAQADAIVTQLNLVIAVLQANGFSI